MAIDFDVARLVPGFLAETRETLASLRAEVHGLRGPVGSGCVTRLVRALHTIKGTAACMHLNDIAEAAHRAETLLLSGPVDATTWRDLRRCLERMGALCEAGSGAAADQPLTTLGQTLERHAGLMAERAKDCGLMIRARVLVRDDCPVDRFDAPALRRALVHALNNCVDHAGEPSEVRRAAGKDEALTVTISAAVRGGSVEVSMADDGAGVDVERVSARARERGLVLEEPEARDASLILRPGVTSSRETTTRVGRGVGLDAAAAAIAESGGSVSVTSSPGRGTTLTFRIPLLNRAAGSDDTASGSAGTLPPPRRRPWTTQA
jgi:chemotaxis protein histidine kinase CheA